MVLDHLAEDQIRFLARWALSINDLQLSDGLLPGDLLASMAMAVWRCGDGWVALLEWKKVWKIKHPKEAAWILWVGFLGDV